MAKVTKRLVYTYWTCESCRKQNLGNKQFCEFCGSPKKADTKFEMPKGPEEAQRVDNEYLKSRNYNLNPDWVDPYTNTLNPDNVDHALGSGAPKSESKEDYFDKHPEIPRPKPPKIKIVDNGRDYKLVDDDPPRPPKPPRKPPSPPTIDINISFSDIDWGKILLILGGVALLGFLIWLGVRWKSGTITDEKWKTFTEVEEYKSFHKNGWDYPSDAYDITYESRIYTYKDSITGYHDEVEYYTERVCVGSHEETEYYTERVCVGSHEESSTEYRDLGNGMAEEITTTWDVPDYEDVQRSRTRTVPDYEDVQRSRTISVPDIVEVPVYRRYYYYTIDRWVNIATDVVESKYPRDKVQFSVRTITDPKKQRIGPQWVEYKIKIGSDWYVVADTTYNKYNVGDSIQYKSAFGSITKIRLIK